MPERDPRDDDRIKTFAAHCFEPPQEGGDVRSRSDRLQPLTSQGQRLYAPPAT